MIEDPRLTEFSVEHDFLFDDVIAIRVKFRWEGKRGETVLCAPDALPFDDSALEDFLRQEIIDWATSPEALQ